MTDEKENLPKVVEERIGVLKLDLDQVTRSTMPIFNRDQVQKLFNSTKARYKYKRPGKGGGQWTYVKGSYVRRVLDSVFGFNWDFEVETSLGEAFEIARATKTCVVKGRLTGRVMVDGDWVAISKTQFGRAEVKMKKDTTDPLDFGNDMKAASTDAFKKCASMMGVAADVYEADEFMEIEIVGAKGNTPQQANTQKQVEKAKTALLEQAKEQAKAKEESDAPAS